MTKHPSCRELKSKETRHTINTVYKH